MSDQEERWFRIDEHSYAVVTAGYAAKRFEEFAQDWQALPWAILALFNAAQAAMVCHLTGTAGLGALEKKCAVEMLAALNRERDYPQERLADFHELLKRTSNAGRQIEQAGGEIKLSRPERQALDRLLKLRRDFAHFSPKGWSIEISGLPEISSSWVRLMRGVHDFGWALRHCEQIERDAFTNSVNAVERVGLQLFRS